MIDYNSSNISGGKGASLVKLKNAGFNVPSFTIVNSMDYKYWKKEGTLPQEAIKRIDSFLNSSKGNFFAVRSSATQEDGEHSSYAGVLETFLYVTRESILENIENCFHSFSNERLKAYEKSSNQSNKNAAMAVVIQEMIESEVSGVLFTRSPDLDNSLVYIESGLGLGEGVVSGLVEVDRYYTSRFNEVIKSDVNNKEEALIYSATNKRIEKVITPEQKSIQSSLNETQLQELTNAALSIENFYNHPCDIEWTYSNNELFILQSRPITQKLKPLELYIDTNLSESYPGHTTPITGDYVNEAYSRTHLELAQLIGLDGQRRKELMPYLDTMTNYVDGHMYYRLESYYNILLSIPGGKQNLQNWHRMIGGEVDHINIKTTVSPADTKDAISYYKFLGTIIFKHSKIFQCFVVNANQKKKDLYNSLDKCKSISDKISLLKYALKSIEGFSLTAFNDVLTMKGLNQVCRILDKYEIDHSIIPTLLKTESGVESLNPLNHLISLSETIKDQEFYDIFKGLCESTKNISIFKRYDKILEVLTEQGYEDTARAISKFIDKYGNRSFEELKLESLTIKQSPELLLSLLKLHETSSSKNEVSVNEEDKTESLDSIGFIDRKILNLVVSKTRKYIATREECRLIRGEMYGWFRECFLSIFEELRLHKDLSHIPTLDFFYLHLNSLYEIQRGEIEIAEIEEIIIKNKKKYLPVNSYPEFLYKEDLENASYIGKVEEDSTITLGEVEVRGLSASKGNIVGKVLVLNNPIEALHRNDLHECILVTKNTDPAWIYIMTKCKGLISEKGSLLSHTAIIGRELNVPTVVGVKNITQLLKNTKQINLDADKGVINIIE